MSEASEVCLVRCPKCENLLQEPHEPSVYQCGSCGTVLQAKKKTSFDYKDLDVSDVEKHRGVSDKIDDNVAAMANDFRAEKAMKGIEPRELDKNDDEDCTLSRNDPSASENSGAAMATRLAKRIENRKFGLSDDRFKHSSDVPNDNWVRDNRNSCFNVDRNAYAGLRFESELQEFRPKPNVNHRNMDRNCLVSSSSNANSVEGRRGFPNSSYGMYIPNSSYGTYTKQAEYENLMDTRARVEMLENDRADLLRKLDELSDKLNRSNNVVDEPRETRFYDPTMPPASTNSYNRDYTDKQSGSSMFYGMSKQPIAADQPVSGHSYMPSNQGFTSNMDGHGSAFLGSYPSGHHMQEYRGFGDVYSPQMLRRPSPQLPNKYLHGSCYEHFPSRSRDLNHDLMPGSHETSHHKSTCSCMHGFNNNLHVPCKLEPPVLYRQNDRNEYTNHVPYSHANCAVYGPQGYVTEESDLSKLHSQDRDPLTISSNDLGMENNGFDRRRLKKPVVTQRVRRVFQPIASGAPFITCCNCSEVLKMPRKLTLMQEKKNKIKCGACSSLLLFEFEKEGLVLSVPAETEQAFVDISASTYESHGQNFRRPYGYPNMGASYTSDEYETLNRDSFSKDVQSNTGLEGGQMFDKDVNEMGQDPHSFSVASDDESSPDSVSLSMHMFHSSGLISKDEVSLGLPDSRDKYLDQLSSDNLMDRKGATKSSDKKNSLKDTLVATEMDVFYDENSANAINQDSSDISRQNEQPTVNKGAESFFLGFIKKSFGSRSSKTTANGRSGVSVNGHFIPVRIVKKAEKLAGPIQPGDYWYDYHAGFWGVMGHPCLGIILPYIDEFNYPMPRNCAGGNTEILLNGRELHKKDLDLLGARGLPTTRQKSYLVEISGRAMDEETGEELDLGKLAPTVEIAKHGFGMRVPKSIPKQ